MSGHSKWANVKHKKAAADAKRGKVFTKLSRAITTAAREGGGDPDMNPSLRLAIDKAKAQNMPNDNIDRAIKRGTGELDGVTYERIQYEGYGPGGVAVMVDVMTDNRNRTVAAIRHLFSKANGNLGQDGCVAWMFNTIGQVTLPASAVPDEDELMLVALEAGADDMTQEDDRYLIVCSTDALVALKEALHEAGFESFEAEVTKVPQNTVDVSGKEAVQVYKLLMALEDQDDVQQVHANCDFDDDTLASI
jgi:YebC/PmpR family DNA-binding regulatory protein